MPSALVTGASSGIGEACVRRLAKSGWRVYAGVRRDEDAERLRDDGVVPILLDVTKEDQVGAVAELDLDGVVANAGIAIAGPAELVPLAEWRRQLEVNVVGQVAVIQAALPALRRSRGRIVLMGSIGGISALPFLGPYVASKFALEAIADSLRLELRPFGIRVAIVRPGTIATPIWRKGGETADALAATYAPEVARIYEPAVSAFRRAAQAAGSRGVPADEVAKAVEHALTAERPKTRYLVGRDAKRRARVERLPDRIRDRILTAYLRRA